MDDELTVAATLDLLVQLVEKSLIQVETGAAGHRYRLLETVRQDARERLSEAGERERFEALHRAWYLDLAETADRDMDPGVAAVVAARAAGSRARQPARRAGLGDPPRPSRGVAAGERDLVVLDGARPVRGGIALAARRARRGAGAHAGAGAGPPGRRRYPGAAALQRRHRRARLRGAADRPPWGRPPCGGARARADGRAGHRRLRLGGGRSGAGPGARAGARDRGRGRGGGDQALDGRARRLPGRERRGPRAAHRLPRAARSNPRLPRPAVLGRAHQSRDRDRGARWPAPLLLRGHPAALPRGPQPRGSRLHAHQHRRDLALRRRPRGRRRGHEPRARSVSRAGGPPGGERRAERARATWRAPPATSNSAAATSRRRSPCAAPRAIHATSPRR